MSALRQYKLRAASRIVDQVNRLRGAASTRARTGDDGFAIIELIDGQARQRDLGFVRPELPREVADAFSAGPVAAVEKVADHLSTPWESIAEAAGSADHYARLVTDKASAQPAFDAGAVVAKQHGLGYPAAVDDAWREGVAGGPTTLAEHLAQRQPTVDAAVGHLERATGTVLPRLRDDSAAWVVQSAIDEPGRLPRLLDSLRRQQGRGTGPGSSSGGRTDHEWLDSGSGVAVASWIGARLAQGTQWRSPRTGPLSPHGPARAVQLRDDLLRTVPGTDRGSNGWTYSLSVGLADDHRLQPEGASEAHCSLPPAFAPQTSAPGQDSRSVAPRHGHGGGPARGAFGSER